MRNSELDLRGKGLGGQHRDDEVQRATLQRADERIVEALDDRKLDIGTILEEGADRGRHDGAEHGGNRTELQPALPRSPKRLDFLFGLGDLGQHEMGIGGEMLAIDGGAHAIGTPVEETDAERLLQRAKALAQGRLRDVQVGGGSAEARSLQHCRKMTKLAKFHLHLPSPAGMNIA